MVLLLNILWFIFGGGFLAWLIWVLLGGLLFITVVGIPFGYAAIVGGIAFFFGLLSRALPVISSYDLRNLEIDSLRKVADPAEEMQGNDSTQALASFQVISPLSSYPDV